MTVIIFSIDEGFSNNEKSYGDGVDACCDNGYLDEWNGDTGEESRDEEEQLPSVDIAEGADEGGGEEAEEALDAHDDAVEQQGVVAKLGVEDLDHRGRDDAPGEELKSGD